MIIILTLVLFLFFWVYPWPTLSNHRIASSSKVLYFAHRGVTTKADENTIEAFNDSYLADVDGIECDVRYTADKVMIIYHDDSIVIGEEVKYIYELRFNEINNTRLQSANKTIDRVLCLDQLLQTLPENILINIEVKSSQISSDKIEQALINLVDQYSLGDRLMVSSFNPFLLRRIKKNGNNIFTGYLIGEDSRYLIANNRLIKNLRYVIGTLYCKPDAINPEINYLNSTMNKLVKRYGMALFPYTVNSSLEFDKAISMGVNGFFSDNIKLINKCR